MNIAIVGAGIIGLMVAWQARLKGMEVSLFEQHPRNHIRNCSSAAAGLLCPYAELRFGHEDLVKTGLYAISLWETLIPQFQLPVLFKREGNYLAAHPSHRDLLTHSIERIQQQYPNVCVSQSCDVIPNDWPCVYITGEGFIANEMILAALQQSLTASGIQWFDETPVTHIDQGEYDWVIDCRGVGAIGDLPNLRAVRGEALLLHAPEVPLTHPIRTRDPHASIYCVPRNDGHLVLGASEIESHDDSPISVKTTLTLLTAAYSLHPGFAEARIVDTMTGCRPAFDDNLPKIIRKDNIIHVNGLYRNGFLLAPVLAEEVINMMNAQPAQFSWLLK